MDEVKRFGAALVSVLAVAVMLTACVALPGPGNDDDIVTVPLTLEEAKAITFERAAEIAGHFPEENVADSRVTETARSLYGCRGEENYSWPSVTVITIAGEPDHEAIISAIAIAWEGREGWTVTRRENLRNDLPRVTLAHADGSRFEVGFYLDGTEFWVDSASPSFHLEGGYDPDREY